MENNSLLDILRENKNRRVEVIHLPNHIINNCMEHNMYIININSINTSSINTRLFQILIERIQYESYFTKCKIKLLCRCKNVNYNLIGIKRSTVYYYYNDNLNNNNPNLLFLKNIQNIEEKIVGITEVLLKFLRKIKKRIYALKVIRKFIIKYKEHYFYRPPNVYSNNGGLYYRKAYLKFQSLYT